MITHKTVFLLDCTPYPGLYLELVRVVAPLFKVVVYRRKHEQSSMGLTVVGKDHNIDSFSRQLKRLVKTIENQVDRTKPKEGEHLSKTKSDLRHKLLYQQLKHISPCTFVATSLIKEYAKSISYFPSLKQIR